jgi:hypothetical protein
VLLIFPFTLSLNFWHNILSAEIHFSSFLSYVTATLPQKCGGGGTKKDATGTSRELTPVLLTAIQKFLDILRDIWDFSQYFIFFIHLFHNFSWNP